MYDYILDFKCLLQDRILVRLGLHCNFDPEPFRVRLCPDESSVDDADFTQSL